MTFDSDVTLEDVLCELNRELIKRNEVYPRWIADRKLNPRVAKKRCDALVLAIAFIEQHMIEDQLTLNLGG